MADEPTDTRVLVDGIDGTKSTTAEVLVKGCELAHRIAHHMIWESYERIDSPSLRRLAALTNANRRTHG